MTARLPPAVTGSTLKPPKVKKVFPRLSPFQLASRVLTIRMSLQLKQFVNKCPSQTTMNCLVLTGDQPAADYRARLPGHTHR